MGYKIYAKDREGVKKYIKEAIETCWGYGVSTMQILFNGNSLDPAMLEPELWVEMFTEPPTRSLKPQNTLRT